MLYAKWKNWTICRPDLINHKAGNYNTSLLVMFICVAI